MLRAGKMSDEKLRRELKALGYTPGPITDSTRRILEKKLEKLRTEAKKSQNSRRSGDNVRKSRHRKPREESDDDDDEEEEDDESPERSTPEPPPPHRQQYLPPRVRADWDSVQEESRVRGREDGGKRTSGESDIPERSSLGYKSYASDIPERSSLSYKSYASDIPDRSSLSYKSYASDIPDRSSLSYKSYASDIPDRSSLSYKSYASDIPERSSLSYKYTSDNPEGSYNRYSSDIPERSSLSYRSYASDNPERSSIGYNKYTSDNSESLSRYNRYGSDNPDRSSIGYSGCSGEELRYRPPGDRSAGPYVPSIRSALDSLSHKTHLDLKQEKASHPKPAWSKKLERYLSRLLRLLCVLLVLVFAGILLVKSGVLSTSQDNGVKLLPSDCEGRGDTFCKAKQKEISLQILSELYDFLSLEAGRYECGNPSGLNSKCIPVNRAKEHVMNVSGHSAEKFDTALDWMLSSDRHFGIWAKGEDAEQLVAERADVFCFESSRPRLGFVCRLKNALYTAVSNLFLALLGIFILWIISIFLKYHWQKLEEEEKQMFAMIEKIIDVVKHHYKDWTLGREQSPYVGILHVRDSLIMPQDRKHLKRVWDRAVQFIEENESRLRTESQRVAGADLRMWRWTQTRNEHPR
ncbi:LEM domain-containing protein 2 [Dendropsophus ebraccatus]|uniref:LEM domain-containing protein 2 n=1 Tax=Dendropsophus ebraccatus TaxID=150705 RepID=UPI003831B8A8